MLAAYEGVELRAIAFKVVIEPLAEPERIIAIVKERQDSFRRGRVLSIGKVAAEKLPDLRVGDLVLYAQSVACTNAVKNRHIVAHDHVLAVVVDVGGGKTPLQLAEEAADFERLKALASTGQAQ